MMHEHDTGMSVRRDRIGEKRRNHVSMSTRFEDDAATEVIMRLGHSVTLAQQRAATRRGKSVDDETQWLTSGVRSDSANTVDHFGAGRREGGKGWRGWRGSTGWTGGIGGAVLPFPPLLP